MNLDKLENTLGKLTNTLDHDEFIYDLLLAYDFPKSSITRLKKGDYNLAKGANEVLWKKKVYFKQEHEQDLHLTIDALQHDESILKQHPRFIIVTDFRTLLAVDLGSHEPPLDIPFLELPQNYTFFLPWAGQEKEKVQSTNPADRKAAEKLGKLYDIIILENDIKTDNERHGLNIFLSRLLFCFFAEDTGIFELGQFTSAIASHTLDDGSNLQDYLIQLFNILNIKEKSRGRSNKPKHMTDFPYVNGGLFAVNYPAPKLNTKARKMIIESGSLNWRLINPDIFGSMMQAVVHSDQRSHLGMHYTSVENIMKVINPLFLNELKQQLEDAGNNENKLTKLLKRLYQLRIFDPACGSGNFLIITYKELCKLEIEIFKRLQLINDKWKTAMSGLRLTQFYGIEIDDFAHETAKLSLWLAEHQMNLEFKEVFGAAKPTLPLQDGGHIVCGNATRLDWEGVCPKDKDAEIYILGNPPYLGARNQNKNQKSDMSIVAGHIKGHKNLDYIACWFIKASQYIAQTELKYAFVSTNSISQGTQVSMLWPHILIELEIFFAHQSFIWSNNAKGKAGVTCVVIGVRKISRSSKYIFNGNLSRSVNHINAYLSDASDIYLSNRRHSLSRLPPINYGSFALDDGNYTISKHERDSILKAGPDAKLYLRRFIGAKELIQGNERYCIWIEDDELNDALQFSLIKDKVERVKSWRLNSGRDATKKLGEFPHRFAEIRQPTDSYLAFPTVSSERRDYIPIAFLNADYIASNQIYVIPSAEAWTFGIISSRIHMTWVRAVAGRLKTDYRYSSALCYNTFPFPEITDDQKETLEEHVFNVLDEREEHPEKTMAELYDPDKMPEGLREAHHAMDLAVEQCYRKKPFKDDEERLEYLFKLYEEMIEAEKHKP